MEEDQNKSLGLSLKDGVLSRHEVERKAYPQKWDRESPYVR